MTAKKGLKAAMCEKLIGEGKVGLYDMIRHSYTNARMSRAGGCRTIYARPSTRDATA